MAVPRQVRFWQITDGLGNQLAGPFAAADLARKIKAFDVDERRHTHSDGWVLDGVTISSGSNPHLALYRIRHENLPSIEHGGEYSDLALDDDENLAEATHFRFFPRNIVGQLHNHDGPGISRLSQYLRDHMGIHIELAPVLRGNAVQTLNRLTDISRIEFKVPVNRAYLLESSGHKTIKALRAMAEESLSKTLYVTVTVWGSSEPSAPTKWKELLKSIVRGEMFSAFESLKVRAIDTAVGDRQTVDLIKEHLTVTEEVELSSDVARAVKSSSAASAIEDAYLSLEKDLKDAVPAFPKNAQKVPLTALKS